MKWTFVQIVEMTSESGKSPALSLFPAVTLELSKVITALKSHPSTLPAETQTFPVAMELGDTAEMTGERLFPLPVARFGLPPSLSLIRHITSIF